MLMNRVESALINSAPRRWLQRSYEVPTLLRLGGVRLSAGARVLELGCGPGYGTELILTRFGAGHVDAVDLDPAMVTRARRRLRRFGERARVAEGSATDLRAALATSQDVQDRGGQDAGYDAVVDFAIIHHVPDWRAALDEVARVLRPGGRFFFDEVTAAALATRTYRTLFDHPTDDRFTAAEFIDELVQHGLHTDPDRWTTRLRGHYLLGVATRASSPTPLARHFPPSGR